jgi:hypothetical protein
MMNPDTMERCERAMAIAGMKARRSESFSKNDVLTRGYPLWIPEDIAEPEPWTLASFADLLPQEMA